MRGSRRPIICAAEWRVELLMPQSEDAFVKYLTISLDGCSIGEYCEENEGKEEHCPMRSRYETARRILVFGRFLSASAPCGAAMILLDPSGKTMGMDGMLPYFQVLPFAEVVFRIWPFPASPLFIVNGLTNPAAAGLLPARKKGGRSPGGISASPLMLYLHSVLTYSRLISCPPSTSFSAFCQAGTGYAAWVFRRQESFTVNMADYPHIGSDPTRLVVYFSRMGYGKKLACEEAERTGTAL